MSRVNPATPLLEVRNLVTSFQTNRGLVRAVDQVSFDIPMRSIVALVGESGCGKSVTSLSILRLIHSPPGRIEQGQIFFEGRDLLKLSEREMCHIRGNKIAMIFQEPSTSLNPVYTIGDQIIEAIRLHRSMPRTAARQQAIDLLKIVGIASPEQRIFAYPHELSGGMRQRAMIAMALACNPQLLIADEPTTALDVTVQAQVLELLKDIQKKTEMSILLITHDLGVVAEFAEWIVVMYAGQVVEQGAVQEVFQHPKHPYTRGLLKAIPPWGISQQRHKRLPTIEGVVPELYCLPNGCRFHPRCPYVIEMCLQQEPSLLPLSEASLLHLSRCHRSREIES